MDRLSTLTSAAMSPLDTFATIATEVVSKLPVPEKEITNIHPITTPTSIPKPPMSYAEYQRRRREALAQRKLANHQKTNRSHQTGHLQKTNRSQKTAPFQLITKSTVIQPARQVSRKTALRVLFRNKLEMRDYLRKDTSSAIMTKHNVVGALTMSTFGDLALEYPRLPPKIIFWNCKSLTLTRDYMTRFDMDEQGLRRDPEYNAPLLFRLFDTAYPTPSSLFFNRSTKSINFNNVQQTVFTQFTEDEISTLKSYGFPSVDALLCPPSYWIFQRLMLTSDHAYIPSYYHQHSKTYLLQAIDFNHARVVERAFHKGIRLQFDLKEPTMHPLVVNIIRWFIITGLINLYTKDCQDQDQESLQHQGSLQHQESLPQVPAMVQLLFRHDRDDLLYLILKGTRSTNRETIAYATQHKANKCLQLLSQVACLS